jgi:hypothetical protein
MRTAFKRLIKQLPYVNSYVKRREALLIEKDRLIAEKDNLLRQNNHLIAEIERQLTQQRQLAVEREESAQAWMTWVPPGHFYSPIQSLDEVREREAADPDLFKRSPEQFPGIDLNPEKQLELLRSFQQFYAEQPFTAEKQEGLRYFFENPNYSYSDAIFLHCMIRHACPQTIVEIGSGYSSCVILDTNKRFFDHSIRCTFIEPYPDLLHSLIETEDSDRVEILAQKLQNIPLSRFAALQAGDILFIDSTHVSKFDSDLNYIFFEILPNLNSGVYIHFHDIFYPFEYPRSWIYEGRAWNEIYLLRAFLQYNNCFEVLLFNTYLEHVYESFFQQQMPLCLKNRGGSIWLKKL